MTIGTLAGIDFSSWEQPDPNLEPRELLESWLRYQRHEFIRKLRDLSPDRLVAWSVPPVELSVLGLVRRGRFGLRPRLWVDVDSEGVRERREVL